MKTKQTLLMVAVVAILGLFATYNNCGLQLPEQAVKQNTSSSTNIDGDAVTDSWIQPSATNPPMKPEMVFVIDRSGSMAPKVVALKNSIEGWLNQLSTLHINDLCLGVINADTNFQTAGKLVAKPGNNLCYCTFGENAVANKAEAIARFSENLDQAILVSGGAGENEAGIYSMQKALQNEGILQDHQAAGCFRSDTSLIPILVSDENDMSASIDDPANNLFFDNAHLIGEGNEFSTTPGDALFHSVSMGPGNFYNEANQRRLYYAKKMTGGPYITDAQGRYVNQITHGTLAQAVKDFNQSFPSFGTSIGFYVDRLPANLADGTPFWGGQQFAEEFNNPMVDMMDALATDQTAFQDEMNQMASALASHLQYYYSFNLTKSICDQNQNGAVDDEIIKVLVNGQVIDQSKYSIMDANRIAFNASFVWTPSAKIEVTYNVCAQ